jgi:hypothetical protein
VALTVRGSWDAPCRTLALLSCPWSRRPASTAVAAALLSRSTPGRALGTSRSDASAWRLPNPEATRLRITGIVPESQCHLVKNPAAIPVKSHTWSLSPFIDLAMFGLLVARSDHLAPPSHLLPVPALPST